MINDTLQDNSWPVVTNPISRFFSRAKIDSISCEASSGWLTAMAKRYSNGPPSRRHPPMRNAVPLLGSPMRMLSAYPDEGGNVFFCGPIGKLNHLAKQFEPKVLIKQLV